MKKRVNSVLSLLLAVTMVMTTLPLSAVTQVKAVETALLDVNFENYEVGSKATATGDFAGGTVILGTGSEAEIVNANGSKVLHLTSDGTNNLYFAYQFEEQTTQVTLSYDFALGTNGENDFAKNKISFPSLLNGSADFFAQDTKKVVAAYGTNNKAVTGKADTWLYYADANPDTINNTLKTDTDDDGVADTIAAPAETWHTVKIVWTPASGDTAGTAVVYYDGAITNVTTLNSDTTSVDTINLRLWKSASTRERSSEIWLDNIKVTVEQDTPSYTYTHDGASMVLENNLNLRFFMNETPVENGAHYAKITKTVPGGDPVEVNIPQSQWKYHSKYQQYYVEFTGMAAKEMGQTFTVTYYDENDQAISETKTMTAKQWLEEGVDLAQGDAEKAVYENLLIYGAAAQNEFDYDKENLVSAAAPTASTAVDNRVKGDSTGTSLVLESTLEMRVYFKAEDLQDGYTWKVEYTGVYGEESDEGTSFFASEFKNDTDKYVPVKVALADINALVAITVLNSEGETVLTAQDSIGSYIARGGNEGIYAALYNLGVAANAYFSN